MTLPKLEVGYGLGKGVDSFATGAESATQAMTGIKECPLAAVLVFASARYDLEAVLQGVNGVVGDVPLVGATTAGEICNEPQQESVVVVTLASPYLKVRVGLGRGVSKDWRQAVAQAVSSPAVEPFFSPHSQIWQELALQGKSAFAILFSPGNTRSADSLSFEILEELNQLSRGLLPIIGAGAADDWRMEANYVLWGQRAYVDSALVVVFETQLRFGIAMAHGYQPSSRQAAVTRSHDHEVLEIKGESAAQQYCRLHNSPLEALEGKHLTLTTKRPMGMLDPYGQYRLNVASFFTAAGGVRFAQPTPEGTILTVMDANLDSQVAAGPEALRKALLRGAVTDPGMALVFSCALRRRILGERVGEEIDGIKDLIPGVPVVGFYSFGEQGQSDYGVNRHNNVVIAVLTLGREFSYGAQVAWENEQLRLRLEQQTTELMVTNNQLLHEIVVRRRAEEALSKNHQELQETTRQLEQSRNLLQLIIESIPIRVFWKDREARYLGCNTLFARDAGLSSPKQLLGQDDFVMGWRDQAQLYRADDLQVMESGRPKMNIIEPQTTPAGGQIWLNTSKVPLLRPNGEVFGVLGIYEDVTERKQAEEALRESEERYRRLFNSGNDAVFVFPLPDQGAPGHFIEVNDPACRQLGYTREEMLQLSLREIAPPELSNKLAEILARLRQRGNVLAEFQHITRDGQKIPVEINAVVFQLHGRPHVLSIVRDITERQRAEEEKAKLEAKLVHAQKMEAIGTLAGGIAHDFNNILTAIIGNISLAMLDQNEDLSRERLMEAEKACLRAQMLARQLLTFASGGAPVKELISITKLVTDSTSFACSGSNVKCDFYFQDNLWEVKADPGQINQVIQNLVINAMQAMPTGGTIEIQGENLLVEADSHLPLAAGRYVKISFRDQGMGIPKEFLSKIFDPYFTTKQKGSGLGLATAYAIIKNHQGHLGVESRVGEGTIFQIYLPAADPGIIKPQPDEEKILKGQGKILIMDDDVMVRNMLKDMLQRLGYEAYCTENGEEAIKSYKEALDADQSFAAVIFDLTVPGAMGGKDAIHKLLEIDPHIKGIVSSGYSDDPIMANYEKYGFRGIISKPYRMVELSKVLFEITSQH